MKRLFILLSSMLLSACGGSTPQKEHVTVTYTINNEAVFLRIIDKGDPLGIDYIYDYDNHQSHASKWIDSLNNEYTKDTIINSNVTVSGVVQANLLINNNEEEDYVHILGINHIHGDGNLVVLESYFTKPAMIDEAALTNNNNVKAIYLPQNLYHLASGNFFNCSKLTKIYYAGTMEQFANLSKDNYQLPSGVNMVYNTSFVIS